MERGSRRSKNISRTNDVMIYTCGVNNTLSQFKDVSVEFILDYFKNHKAIAVDTETKGFNFHSKPILSLQLGDEENQFVIDVRKINILRFKDLLESKLCLLHNAKFDYKFLLKAGIVLHKIYDTMLAEMVIWNGIPRRFGLNHLHENYLGIHMFKDVRGEFYKIKEEEFTEAQINYGALDVAKLHAIGRIQHGYIKKFDLQFAVNLECDVVKALADMEFNGVLLNVEEWTELAFNVAKQRFDTEIKLDTFLIENRIFPQYSIGYDLFGNQERLLKINYNSDQQVLAILKKLQCFVTDTGKQTLQSIRNPKALPFVELLLKHRELAKKESTYGKKFLEYINKSSGRIHTNFWQVKETFRLSSDKPNMQNIPSSNTYRNRFKPRKGFTWVSIDYSGQEMRIMADFSKEEGFIEPIKQGKDIHCYVASKVFGRTITKEDKKERTQIKSVNFMKPYGGGTNKLTEMMGIPLEESERIFRLYEHSFPKLNKWLDDSAKFGKQNKYIVIHPKHKGRRWFKNINKIPEYKFEGEVERQSMNSPIQGTGAIAMKQALVDIRSYLIESGHWQKNVFMILTVHDEVNLEIKDEFVEELTPIIEDVMVKAGSSFLTYLSMEIDTTKTKQWQK